MTERVDNNPGKNISRREFLQLVGTTTLAAGVTLFLEGCRVTPSKSPIIFCHDPTQPDLPNAISFIVFSREGDEIVVKSQSFRGSPEFTPDEEGRLTPFVRNGREFVNTTLDNYNLLVDGNQIDLGGCLVEEQELDQLQDFFRAIPTDQEFKEQTG